MIDSDADYENDKQEVLCVLSNYGWWYPRPLTTKYRVSVPNLLGDRIKVIITGPKWVKAVKDNKDNAKVSRQGYPESEVKKQLSE